MTVTDVGPASSLTSALCSLLQDSQQNGAFLLSSSRWIFRVVVVTLQVAAFAAFTYLSACFSRLHRLSAGNVLSVHTDGEHRDNTDTSERHNCSVHRTSCGSSDPCSSVFSICPAALVTDQGDTSCVQVTVMCRVLTSQTRLTQD